MLTSFFIFTTVGDFYIGHDFALDQGFFFSGSFSLNFNLSKSSSNSIYCEQIYYYVHFYFRKDTVRLNESWPKLKTCINKLLLLFCILSTHLHQVDLFSLKMNNMRTN